MIPIENATNRLKIDGLVDVRDGDVKKAARLDVQVPGGK
jgi:hypothetical protein